MQQGTGVGTGVQLLTVEQECQLLEANVKHSEGSKLVLTTQLAASKCAFLKSRLDRSENTNSETELNTISKGMGNRFCNVQLCHSSWS